MFDGCPELIQHFSSVHPNEYARLKDTALSELFFWRNKRGTRRLSRRVFDSLAKKHCKGLSASQYFKCCELALAALKVAGVVLGRDESPAKEVRKP